MARCQRSQWDSHPCSCDAVGMYLVIPPIEPMLSVSGAVNTRMQLWLCTSCGAETFRAEKSTLTIPIPEIVS
jgi:hypothetical protein